MGHELGDIVADRVGDDFARGADLHQPTALHQRNAVADLEGLIQIMAHKNDGAFQFCLKIQQFILQLGADQRIQRAKGFVHQQNRRFGGKGAGKADALLHAARQFAHLALGPLGEVHQFQLLIHLGAALSGCLARQFQPKAHIFAHAAPRQKAELLEHHGNGRQAQSAQGIGAGMGDRHHLIARAHPHLAAHHGVQRVHPAQKR